MKTIDFFSSSENIKLSLYISKIKLIKYNDDKLKLFNQRLDLFLNKYPIQIDSKNRFIHYNYIDTLYLYYYQKSQHLGKSEHTLNEFLNVAIRLLELAIFIENKQLNSLKNKLFKGLKFDSSIYNHFIKIKDSISNNDITIEYLEVGKKPRIFLDDNYYRSSSMPVLNEKEKHNFSAIFKLNNEQNYAVCNGILNEKIQDSTGGNGNLSKRTGLKQHIFTYEDLYSNKSISKNSSKETIQEFQAKLNQKPSTVFTDYRVTKKTISKFKIDNSYKQHLINKAISIKLTKNSMYLKSDYSFPHISQLKKLISELIKVDTVYSKSILLAIFTGLDVKDIYYSLLGVHPELDYLSTGRYFRFIIPKDIYAENKSNQAQIHLSDEVGLLSDFIYRDVKTSRNELKDDTVDDYVNFIEAECKALLFKTLKTLDKTVKLSYSSLSKCLRHYYSQYNSNSDLSTLLQIKVNQTDKAKLCYVQQQARLENYEHWSNDFYFILNDKPTNSKVYDKNEKIGSPYFIEPEYFKDFIDDLDEMFFKSNDKIFKLNLQMIFIRYSLSLLLATRDFKNSCELLNISRRHKILTIHEKAKNIKTSKRFAPLCDYALKLIDFFYKLKKQNPIIQDNKPMLIIDNKTEEINKENLTSLFENNLNTIDSIKINKTIGDIKLNVGRHVISTLMRRENIKQEYEDAFLGHFHQGKVDQGIHSNFDNKDYKKTIIEFINNEIVTEYIPKRIFMIEGI